MVMDLLFGLGFLIMVLLQIRESKASKVLQGTSCFLDHILEGGTNFIHYFDFTMSSYYWLFFLVFIWPSFIVIKILKIGLYLFYIVNFKYFPVLFSFFPFDFSSLPILPNDFDPLTILLHLRRSAVTWPRFQEGFGVGKYSSILEICASNRQWHTVVTFYLQF